MFNGYIAHLFNLMAKLSSRNWIVYVPHLFTDVISLSHQKRTKDSFGYSSGSRMSSFLSKGTNHCHFRPRPTVILPLLMILPVNDLIASLFKRWEEVHGEIKFGSIQMINVSWIFALHAAYCLANVHLIYSYFSGTQYR